MSFSHHHVENTHKAVGDRCAIGRSIFNRTCGCVFMHKLVCLKIIIFDIWGHYDQLQKERLQPKRLLGSQHSPSCAPRASGERKPPVLPKNHSVPCSASVPQHITSAQRSAAFLFLGFTKRRSAGTVLD